MSVDNVHIEKTVAVVLVAVALLFVAYQEFSNSLGGALIYSRNVGYANCRDSDPANDVTVQGRVTVSRLNLATDMYEPLEPYVDACLGLSRVREWECSNYDKPIPIETGTYCPEDMVCRNGACI